MISSDALFYVYEHWRPDLGVCFYVGKGSGARIRTSKRAHNKSHMRIVESLHGAGLRVQTRVVARGLSEAEAFNLERALIKKYGKRKDGGSLVNRTNGGNGASGAVRSAEARKRYSEAAKKRSAESKARIVAALVKRNRSPEQRAATAMANRMRVMTPETRAKIGAASKGRNVAKGRVASEAARLKMSIAHKGKKLSAEQRAKISEAMKGNKHAVGPKGWETRRRRAAEREAAQTAEAAPSQFSRRLQCR